MRKELYNFLEIIYSLFWRSGKMCKKRLFFQFNGDKMMEVQLEYYFRGGMEHVPDFFVELGLIRLDRQSRGPQPQQHGYAPRGGPPGL